MQKFMPYSSNVSSVESIAHKPLKQSKLGNTNAVKGAKNNLNESSVMDSSYDNSQIMFSNPQINNTVASISQSSVRSAHMNQTSAHGFTTNLNSSMTNGNQPRNSVVGSRQIPITKFSRGHTRGRVSGVDGAKNRVTSINFYQSGQAKGAKLKNGIDLNMSNKLDGKNQIVLN